MNSINIVGRMTADVELRTTPSGKFVVSFSVAVKRPRMKDTTDFLQCVAWNSSAEYLYNYVNKGDLVGIAGVLTSRKWQDKDGKNHTIYEIVCDSVERLTQRFSQEGVQTPTQDEKTPQSAEYATTQAQEAEQANFVEIANDDDLPF